MVAQGRKGEITLAVFQYINLVLAGIAYTIAAGQSARWVVMVSTTAAYAVCLPLRGSRGLLRGDEQDKSLELLR